MSEDKRKKQKKEYEKAKPFSKAGRMRAAAVAMGAIKGPTPDRQAEQKATKATADAEKATEAAADRSNLGRRRR